LERLTGEEEAAMQRMLLFAALWIAVPAFGQLTPAHRFDLYASPQAASAAVEALMTSQRELALIIPFRTDLTSVSLGQESEGVTYAVAYQAAPWEQGAVEAQVTLGTTVWNGSEICGWGMKSWQVRAFATSSDAKKFYDGLIPLQKGTAYLLPAVGPQLQRNRYIVVFQALAAHCS
jgi:hypothetical protein